MLMRYIGPLDEVQVAVAGNDFGVVKQGEAIVVPDALAETVGWSEHWENVKATKKAVKDAKNTDAGTANLDVNSDSTQEPGTADEDKSDANTVNPDIDENIATDKNEDGN